MIDQKQLSEITAANKLPINQAAANFLHQTDWGVNPTRLHCLALMMWGLENGVVVRAMDEPADLLTSLENRLGPVGMSKLVEGSLDATTPLEAASQLLETLLVSLEAQTGISTHPNTVV